MNISIVGSGYVGLVAACGFARNGHTALCIDRDGSRVELINEGKSPLYEDGLHDVFFTWATSKGRLKASLDYREILRSDVTFVCVGTSPAPDESCDLTCVEDSVRDIGAALADKRSYHLVAVKSTVPPGTTRGIVIPLLERFSGKQVGQDLGVVVNPEFLQEGRAMDCFLNPDRIVIGESDVRAGDLMEQVYAGFGAPVVRTDLTTAEMIKYASNAFLATKISFINEVGNICQKLGIDVYEVAYGMGYDPRIGRQFLNSGIGFGGSCLPKDLQALIATSKKAGYPPYLLEAVLDVNKSQATRMVETAERKLGCLEGKRVAVLGLAFKPDTDDVRAAPAIRVIEMLLQKKAVVVACDPAAVPNARLVLPEGVEYCESAKEATADADCVLIVTEWADFKRDELYQGKVVIDGRRVLDPGRARTICEYLGINW